jgi:hypothetical protein
VSLGVTLLLVALSAFAFAPVWPCPVCVDFDIAIFGRCGECGGTRIADRSGNQRISLWKRWRVVRDLQAEGCRSIPLFPR